MQPDPKVNILLVDDQPENLMALAAVIDNLGQNLIKVNSGEEALRQLLDRDFAVILLDVQMPGMDGFETATLIRQRERSRHTPIIFLTAFNTSESLVFKGYALKAVDYLIKPIEPEILLSKVAVFVELHQKTAELERQKEQLEQAEEARAQVIREQEARRQAEEANRMKDEFLTMLSHELRTPLNSILGWTQVLRTREYNPATAARALEIIERNAKAQTALIEDILDVSRIIRGQLRLNLCPTTLFPIVETTVQALRPSAAAKTIQLDSILSHSVGQVLADSQRLQQVMGNLLSNAIKFTPKGGRVEIRLSEVSGNVVDGRWHVGASLPTTYHLPPTSYAQISVSDTGIGINLDFLPFIFDRFRQADSSTTRNYGGLGLGLAIVRHIVELHDGFVWADSPGEGRGATFTVLLPLMKDKSSSKQHEDIYPSQALANSLILPSQTEIQPSSLLLAGARVLIVDDEPDVLTLLTMLLEEQGAKVTAVDSVLAALAAIAQLQPHVLVSDISMPDADGYTLIRQVRELDIPVRNVPAIALTAYGGQGDVAKVLAAGFQKYLSKPIELAEFIATIAELVNSPVTQVGN